jgi:hypothetical protein
MFDIHQTTCNQHGEQDERKIGAYIEGLIEAFAESPEGKPLAESDAGIGWAATMMHYGLDYIGETPATMGLRDFNEIVFGLFPQKVSVEPDKAEEIVTEVRAFWQFVQRKYGVPNAAQILASLDASTSNRLRAALADTSRYGMAKSFYLQGVREGYDMTTKEGLDQFMLEYNRRLAETPRAPRPEPTLPERIGWEGPPAIASVRPDGADRERKRQEKKRQRQSRKRNRRH